MYIGNIIMSFNELHEEEVLLINYGSGKQSKVYHDDKILKINGDLKFERTISKNRRCIIIVDCAEVESLVIQKGEYL